GYWENDGFEVRKQEGRGKYGGFGFDGWIWEMLGRWMGGGEVDMMEEGIGVDMMKVNWYFNEEGMRIGLVRREVCEEFMWMENDCVG
uniref:hypothetical protein n=1 Tax=Bacillus altitudinis TaxID=293387 RepID=UPI001C93166B